MSLNLDSLAETAYADADPQFKNDQELTEAEVMTHALWCIDYIADELTQSERQIVLDRIDDLIDRLYEVLSK